MQTNQYYIPWAEGYNVVKLLEVLAETHGRKGRGLGEITRVRTAKQYGWHNQPDVVCFSSIHPMLYVKNYILPTVENVNPRLNIMRKDW